MPISTGQLKDRVTIQTRTIIRTSTGEIETWSDDLETRWCRVVPISRPSQQLYDQGLARSQYKVIFRGAVNLTLANHRLLWKTRDFGLVLVPTSQEIRPGGPSGGFTTVFCVEDPDQAFPAVG